MEVVQLLSVSHGAGRVAEVHVGQFLGSLQHEGLMTEAVGENDLAAFIGQVQSGFIAVIGFGNVALDDHLVIRQSQSSGGILHAVDEVQVVGGIFVVQQDDTQLDVFLGNTVSQGRKSGQAQGQSQNQGKNLFHVVFPPLSHWTTE